MWPNFLLVASLWAASGAPSEATDPLPVHRDGRVGYIDHTGTLVIPARYDTGGPFVDGRAVAETGARRERGAVDHSKSKFGFLAPDGTWAIEPRFEYARSFSEGLAAVRVERKYGFVDRDGALAIPARFTRRVGDFHEGRAWVELGPDVLGYVDRSGELVARLSGVDVGDPADFSDGLARVETTAGELRYIDLAGEVVLTLPHAFGRDFREGLAAVRTQEGKWGFIDREGTFVLPPVYDFAWGFVEGLAIVTRDGVTTYVDRTGKAPFACAAYDDLGTFSEGLARVRVRESGRYGYIDRSGALVIPARFEDAQSSRARFEEGVALAATLVDGARHTGYIDRRGEWIAPPTR